MQRDGFPTPCKTKTTLLGCSPRIQFHHPNRVSKGTRVRGIPLRESTAKLARKLSPSEISQAKCLPVSRRYRDVVVKLEPLEKKKVRVLLNRKERIKKGMKLRLAYVSHYAPLRYIRKRIYVYIHIYARRILAHVCVYYNMIHERVYYIVQNHICATPNRCKPPLHRFSNVSVFSPFSAIDILHVTFSKRDL